MALDWHEIQMHENLFINPYAYKHELEKWIFFLNNIIFFFLASSLLHTWYKSDFTEQYPTRCKIQLKLYKATDTIMQFDRDFTCMFHDWIGHVWELYWFTIVIITANAKVSSCLRKYLLKEASQKEALNCMKLLKVNRIIQLEDLLRSWCNWCFFNFTRICPFLVCSSYTQQIFEKRLKLLFNFLSLFLCMHLIRLNHNHYVYAQNAFIGLSRKFNSVD